MPAVPGSVLDDGKTGVKRLTESQWPDHNYSKEGFMLTIAVIISVASVITALKRWLNSFSSCFWIIFRIAGVKKLKWSVTKTILVTVSMAQQFTDGLFITENSLCSAGHVSFWMYVKVYLCILGSDEEWTDLSEPSPVPTSYWHSVSLPPLSLEPLSSFPAPQAFNSLFEMLQPD